MLTRIFLLLVGITVALFPSVALAADEADYDGGLIFRVDGPVHVAQGETVGTVFVISGDATIDGTVTDSVIVIDGDLTVTGTGNVEHDITVVEGTLDLQTGAHAGYVSLIRSEYTRADGVTIDDGIDESDAFVTGTDWAVFSAFVWIGMTVLVILAGLIFAAVGARQLAGAGRRLTDEPIGTLVSMAFVWVGIPFVAIVAMMTLIGIPFGVGLLFFLMPAIWFIGYLVAGARLGSLIVGRFTSSTDRERPYLAATVGLFVLQAIGLIPFLGIATICLSGLVGAGAVGLYAFRAWKGEPAPKAPALQPTSPVPAS